MTMKYTKEFQTRHQLLVWRQKAIIENHWYKIIRMDFENNRLFVKRLDSGDDNIQKKIARGGAL